MKPFPVLTTDRLRLRAFELADAAQVTELAGHHAIADTTLTIPHPYEDGMAEQWIGTHGEAYDKGEGLSFAITVRESGALVGAIGIHLAPTHDRAEMGYWIGKPYWGRGYATEAARAVMAYGFDELDLNRVQACHFPRNPQSGRVMQKLGMTLEGILRQHVKKRDRFEDTVMYGILRSEYSKPRAP